MTANIHIGPDGPQSGEIDIQQKDQFSKRGHETIERKGAGHPDTIADRLASQISRSYANYTVENCDGYILHHQVDKLMIIGGASSVTWGAGEFTEPIKIIVAGRATRSYLGESIPVQEIVEQTIKSYFEENLPLVDTEEDIVIQQELTANAGPGTIHSSQGAIADMFSPAEEGSIRGYEKVVANDTSYCVSHAPLSPLERAVIDAEQYLTSEETQQSHPWLGTDVKIMAVRNDNEIGVTVCIPQIARYVDSLSKYQENLRTITDEFANFFEEISDAEPVEISVNTKDDYEKNNVYLTVAGSSLAGDIGTVGRGNRTNGVITSNRPMSLEGTNGKNPRYYSGFIYAILTKQLSQALHDEFEREVVAEIVSQNGGDLLDPWKTTIKMKHDPEEEERINQIVKDHLEGIHGITDEFLNGEITAW